MTAVIDVVAKAINGPHLPVPDGVGYTLEHLREIRWRNHTTEAERQQARNSARAALVAMQEVAVGLAYEKYDEGGGVVDAVFRDALDGRP